MCQSVVNLAERDGHRYISQCEHGTVHLVWDAVGLHLPADALRYLATNFLRTAEELLTQNEPTERGHCRLQVGRIAVDLPLADFLLMAAMVDEALPEVNLYEPRARCATPAIAFPHFQQTPMLN